MALASSSAQNVKVDEQAQKPEKQQEQQHEQPQPSKGQAAQSAPSEEEEQIVEILKKELLQLKIRAKEAEAAKAEAAEERRLRLEAEKENLELKEENKQAKEEKEQEKGKNDLLRADVNSALRDAQRAERVKDNALFGVDQAQRLLQLLCVKHPNLPEHVKKDLQKFVEDLSHLAAGGELGDPTTAEETADTSEQEASRRRRIHEVELIAEEVQHHQEMAPEDDERLRQARAKPAASSQNKPSPEQEPKAIDSVAYSERSVMGKARWILFELFSDWGRPMEEDD